MDNLKTAFTKYFSNDLINLFPIEDIDIPLIQSWINDEEISYFNGTRFPVSLSEQKEWYLKLIKDTSKKKLIISSKEGVKVGLVSLINIDFKNSNAEIAVYIAPAFQKMGYASNSLNMMIKFAFIELRLYKIYANILDFNSPSIRTFEKLGFQREAILKNEYFSSNKYNDIIRLSIFSDQYK